MAGLTWTQSGSPRRRPAGCGGENQSSHFPQHAEESGSAQHAAAIVAGLHTRTPSRNDGLSAVPSRRARRGATQAQAAAASWERRRRRSRHVHRGWTRRRDRHSCQGRRCGSKSCGGEGGRLRAARSAIRGDVRYPGTRTDAFDRQTDRRRVSEPRTGERRRARANTARRDGNTRHVADCADPADGLIRSS